ncbi:MULTISPECIES: gas vesicle protein GvpJ [Streptomyces]|uniref:gas vesicle protein GvpJ n=1 Tax=Streptomyces TaxID=1883 RepID=UPI00048F617B|nr:MULTISPECIES: gas vesicle protein GvpJ [unclassified Streptomyces]MYR74323.1 gas vesicle structural protein GvpA [Streptomyces sp. SID4925]MYY15922.1 gas vesicle structural protein GvpA [Streptomyces sp. SID4912]SBV03617.1 Gas vesicle protein [Streptomyces sp. OspMP-M45]SCE05303.1 Gas vesicle protein [Streptomyces sp. DpondAA-D4]
MTTNATYTEAVACAPRTGTLYDVLELILDRGMVIDIFVRVSLVGIEILKIDARIVVASVDTYLRFAEVCNRLDLANDPSSRTVPELFTGIAGGVAKSGAKSTAKSVGGRLKDAVGLGYHEDEDGDEDEHEEREPAPKRGASRSRSRSSDSETSRAGRRTRSRTA